MENMRQDDASVNDDPRPAWLLDDFDPRCVLAAGLWRHSEALQYVVGLVASQPVFAPRSRAGRAGWVALNFEEAVANHRAETGRVQQPSYTRPTSQAV
jgi:hypothetical protein